MMKPLLFGLTLALIGTSACQTTGSVLGASISDLDAPFAKFDLTFDT